MSAEEVFRAMDAGENRLAAKIRQIVRRFINKIPRENLGAVTLGQTYKWWTEEVDEGLLTTIRGIWLDGYYVRRTNGVIEKSSLEGLESYMARVNDRLVRGLEPPLPEAAFTFVRQAIVTGAVQGWSRAQTAQYIAALLSWETDGDYWRQFKAETDEKIDSILDPLGAPGSGARETAKAHDPRVVQLRDQRNLATKHLDDERSYWERRAMAIARTESTAAFNYAGLVALTDEGFAQKEWLATRDTRTRESHRLADGQTVPLASPFIVGGALLQIPGDPTAPPDETVNCRCTIIGSDSITAAIKPPRDGDGDGWIDDGKPTMRPAPAKLVDEFVTAWTGDEDHPPGQHVKALIGGSTGVSQLAYNGSLFVMKTPFSGAEGLAREVAASDVAAALGFEVASRAKGNRLISNFVGTDNGKTWRDANPTVRLTSLYGSGRMAVLDMLLQNKDRHDLNWRVGLNSDDEVEVLPIDHELSNLDTEYDNLRQLVRSIDSEFVRKWFFSSEGSLSANVDELRSLIAELPFIREGLEKLSTEHVTRMQKQNLLNRLTLIEEDLPKRLEFEEGRPQYEGFHQRF